MGRWDGLRTISWPGAKYRVMGELLQWCPYGPVDCFCEPFFGTGALTLAYLPQVTGPVFAAEANNALFNWWDWLRRYPDEVVERAAHFREKYAAAKTDRGTFDLMRDSWNDMPKDTMDSAALLWCLIYASTNNLARFNQNGGYNQTWGRGRTIPDPRLIFSKEILDRVCLLENHLHLYHDFRGALDAFLDYTDAGHTGVCYLDPPYILEAGMYDAHQWGVGSLGQMMHYIEGLEERSLWWLYTDYLRKGESLHPYSIALSRFRQRTIISTRDARPTGTAREKEEALVLGSVVEKRLPTGGLQWAAQ